MAVNTVNSEDQKQSVRGQILLYDHWKELKWRSLYVVVGLLVAGYNGLVFGEGIINLSWVLVNMHTVESAYTNNIVAMGSDTVSVWSSTVEQSWGASSGQQSTPTLCLNSGGEIVTTGNEQPVLDKERWRVEKLIYTEITEGLWSRLWVAGYVSIMVSVPLVVYHVYTFVKPGLLWLEAQRLKQIMWAFIFLLVAGLIVSFGLVLPRASAYLLNFQSWNMSTPSSESAISSNLLDLLALTPAVTSTSVHLDSSLLDIKYLGKVQSWVDFTIGISKYVVLAFELPLILLLVGAVGLKLRAPALTDGMTVKGELDNNQLQTPYKNRPPIKTLCAWCLTPLNRKLLLFSLTVVAAISSPPDVISLFLVLVPLITLVELTILVSIYLELVAGLQLKLHNGSAVSLDNTGCNLKRV